MEESSSVCRADARPDLLFARRWACEYGPLGKDGIHTEQQGSRKKRHLMNEFRIGLHSKFEMLVIPSRAATVGKVFNGPTPLNLLVLSRESGNIFYRGHINPKP